MNIMELDEAQGLTEEHVLDYVKRCGWEQTYIPEVWKKDGYRCVIDPKLGESVWDIIDWATRERGLPKTIEMSAIQAVLHELNPRLHKGAPSKAAREAHKGRWLAVSPSGFGYLVKFDELRDNDDYDPEFEVHRSSGHGALDDPFRDPGCSYRMSNFRNALAEWWFWPCDRNGNKVPWPTDEQGRML